AGILVGGGFLDNDTDMEDALHALGIEGSDAEKCRDAIAEGAIVVTAETDGDKPSGGGPDLSRGGIAEAVFRRSGAETIL
ncbi:hypothetical protein K0U00_31160, partial [Paenibacillus sepulcri]|nr:hypothetical protein [Paenibacillus sepulcri]